MQAQRGQTRRRREKMANCKLGRGASEETNTATPSSWISSPGTVRKCVVLLKLPGLWQTWSSETPSWPHLFSRGDSPHVTPTPHPPRGEKVLLIEARKQ